MRSFKATRVVYPVLFLAQTDCIWLEIANKTFWSKKTTLHAHNYAHTHTCETLFSIFTSVTWLLLLVLYILGTNMKWILLKKMKYKNISWYFVPDILFFRGFRDILFRTFHFRLSCERELIVDYIECIYVCMSYHTSRKLLFFYRYIFVFYTRVFHIL